jgi:hypothetical protein
MTNASPSLKARLILLAATSLFAMGFAECGLRVIGRGAGAGWAGVPAIEDRLAAVPAKVGKRALALGDSFTEYKDDVGANWFRVALRDVQGFDGVNLGQMGTGLKHYRLNLDTFARGLEPDVVITALYLGNDIQDYELLLAKQARGIPIEPVTTTGRKQTGWVASLKKASVLFATLARITRGLLSSSSVFDDNLAHAAEIYGLDSTDLATRLKSVDLDLLKRARGERINPWDLVFAIVRPTRYADLTLLREGTDARAALALFLADLESFHTACSAIARCAYVVIPAPPQVAPRHADYLRRVGYEIPDELAGHTPLMRELTAFLSSKHMPFVDLVPVLAAHPDGDLFLPDDTHLNDRGQEIAGLAARALLDATGPQGGPASDGAGRDPTPPRDAGGK